MAIYSQSAIKSGLGTLSIGVPNAGVYVLQGTITLPRQSQGDNGNSQIITTINVNGGSTLLTTAAGADSFVLPNLVVSSANSTINIILSSSASVDLGLNKINIQANISEIV